VTGVQTCALPISTEQPTETAPSLQLPVGETETLPQGPRFQLNGKSNGHKAWNGYP